MGISGLLGTSVRIAEQISSFRHDRAPLVPAQAYGMFVYNEETRTYWFNATSMEAETEFTLVGQLMGLAIYNSVILDAHFPHCLYLKLLAKQPTFQVRQSSEFSVHMLVSVFPFRPCSSLLECMCRRSGVPYEKAVVLIPLPAWSPA